MLFEWHILYVSMSLKQPDMDSTCGQLGPKLGLWNMPCFKPLWPLPAPPPPLTPIPFSCARVEFLEFWRTSMTSLGWIGEMMQRESNQISNVVWEVVKQIAPLFEAKQKIDLDSENFYTSLDNTSSHYRMQLRNEWRLMH